MKYRHFMSIIIFSTLITFLTWVVYKILLFIGGYLAPIRTIEDNIIGFLPVFIAMLIGVSLLIIFVNIHSPSRKTRADITRHFVLEDAKIRFQIKAEQNEEKRKDLEERRVKLRQEHENISSDHLLNSDGTSVEDWRKSLLVSRKRLLDEEDRLLLNNQINLEAAIFMAFVGVAFPTYYIFSGSDAGISDDFDIFFSTYGPIFSIVVIFEIIAVFFLRLYALTEQRLEKNKNEITNIELRLTAGLMLSEKTNKDNFAILASDLAKEERNFVLGKNESSAVLDTDKLLELLSKLTPKIGG